MGYQIVRLLCLQEKKREKWVCSASMQRPNAAPQSVRIAPNVPTWNVQWPGNGGMSRDSPLLISGLTLSPTGLLRDRPGQAGPGSQLPARAARFCHGPRSRCAPNSTRQPGQTARGHHLSTSAPADLPSAPTPSCTPPSAARWPSSPYHPTADPFRPFQSPT